MFVINIGCDQQSSAAVAHHCPAYNSPSSTPYLHCSYPIWNFKIKSNAAQDLVSYFEITTLCFYFGKELVIVPEFFPILMYANLTQLDALWSAQESTAVTSMVVRLQFVLRMTEITDR